ncbi:MAG: RNA-binding protein [candidate division Zixibacteria bacterium]|nr:RNA-binding protein [candidate division Zixibacteria bacterium]
MQGSKLYVGNLNYAATEDQLQELFAGHGEVRDVKIIEGKGFGFVEMSSPEEAETAKTELDGSMFMGRTMRVDAAHPRKSGPRREYRSRE